MAEKKEKTEAAAEPAGNKTPLIAAAVVVALVAIGAMIFMSGNGVAESEEQEVAQAAQDGEAPMIKLGNPVVAMVNGEEIRRSDVFNFISGLPEQVRQMPIQALFPLALDQVVNNRVISAKAEAANLEADPEVEQLVVQAKNQIVRNVFVERQIDEQITQKKLLDAYEDLLTEIGEITETKALHILLEDQEKAQEVIAMLEDGGDFAELAQEHSTGPTAENGGELGWFAQNEMVPEFANAAFAIEPGNFTKDPVQTQFGWHVIKVEERRQRPEPEFETVKPQLEAQLRQQTLNDLVEGWQDEADIEKYDINGEPVQN